MATPDLPDYTRTINVYLTAELITQLGSLPWWMRYAPQRILFLDDFEGVLKWIQASGTVAKVSDSNAFEGSNSMQLTTGALAGAQAFAELYLGLVPRSKMAVQLRWSSADAADTTLRSIDFRITRQDGSYETTAALRYLKNLTTPQNKWQYMNSVGAWADVPGGAQTLDMSERTKCFFRLKADFSLDVLRYISLESDALEVDLSALGLYHAPAAIFPHVYPQIIVTTDVDVASVMHIDAYCLSDREL